MMPVLKPKKRKLILCLITAAFLCGAERRFAAERKSRSALNSDTYLDTEPDAHDDAEPDSDAHSDSRGAVR